MGFEFGTKPAGTGFSLSGNTNNTSTFTFGGKTAASATNTSTGFGAQGSLFGGGATSAAQSSTPKTFGVSASAPSTGFGATAATGASTASQGGFGGFKSGFGAPSSTLGATSTGFGAPSSGFGAPSASPSTGFGSFAPKPAGTFGGFGTGTSTFGSAPTTNFSSGSTFGSTPAFGAASQQQQQATGVTPQEIQHVEKEMGELGPGYCNRFERSWSFDVDLATLNDDMLFDSLPPAVQSHIATIQAFIQNERKLAQEIEQLTKQAESGPHGLSALCDRLRDLGSGKNSIESALADAERIESTIQRLAGESAALKNVLEASEYAGIGMDFKTSFGGKTVGSIDLVALYTQVINDLGKMVESLDSKLREVATSTSLQTGTEQQRIPGGILSTDAVSLTRGPIGSTSADDLAYFLGVVAPPATAGSPVSASTGKYSYTANINFGDMQRNKIGIKDVTGTRQVGAPLDTHSEIIRIMATEMRVIEALSSRIASAAKMRDEIRAEFTCELGAAEAERVLLCGSAADTYSSRYQTLSDVLNGRAGRDLGWSAGGGRVGRSLGNGGGEGSRHVFIDFESIVSSRERGRGASDVFGDAPSISTLLETMRNGVSIKKLLQNAREAIKETSGTAAAPAPGTTTLGFSGAQPASGTAPASSTGFSFGQNSAAQNKGAPSTTSGFSFGTPAAGGTSSNPTPPAFGGFGKAPQTPAPSAPAAFAGFGKASQTPASSAPTGFGGHATAQATPPAFGGFGKTPAPAEPSAPSFGGFGKAPAAPGTPTPTAPPAFGGFGKAPAPAETGQGISFGGFGNATGGGGQQQTSGWGFGK